MAPTALQDSRETQGISGEQPGKASVLGRPQAWAWETRVHRASPLSWLHSRVPRATEPSPLLPLGGTLLPRASHFFRKFSFRTAGWKQNRRLLLHPRVPPEAPMLPTQILTHHNHTATHSTSLLGRNCALKKYAGG